MKIKIENQISSKQVEQLFPELTEENAVLLASCLEPLKISAGQTLFHAGDSTGCVFVLLEGRLAVSRETGFNNKKQVIALFRPYAIVGEGSIFGEAKRTATVNVIEDAFLLKLRQQVFIALEEEHPEIAVILLKKLLSTASRRLEKCSERLVHIL